jgi:hypothetical protein
MRGHSEVQQIAVAGGGACSIPRTMAERIPSVCRALKTNYVFQLSVSWGLRSKQSNAK